MYDHRGAVRTRIFHPYLKKDYISEKRNILFGAGHSKTSVPLSQKSLAKHNDATITILDILIVLSFI
jgi:hypothetical protein